MVDQLLKALKGDQSEILDSFVNNPCSDMAEYNRRVGKFMGLEIAEQQLLTLITPKEDDEDRR